MTTDKEFQTQYDELKQALRIDRNALDDACETHADLYLKVQEAYVFAKSIADERDTAMKEEASNAAGRIRKKAIKDPDCKWTESQVKEAVVVDEAHLQSIADYQTAKTRADLLLGLVKAWEARGKMIQELSNLHGRGYFAVNSTRRVSDEIKEQDASQARRAVAAIRMRRR